jgi:hypothetical protein
MDRPLHFLATVAFALLGPTLLVAEDAPDESASQRTRAISPYLRRVLNDASARVAPPPPSASDASAESAARQRVALEDPDLLGKPVVRLPEYHVREPKLPSPQEVMTRKALEQYAMNKYLGDERGFDRGFLNLFNLASLWKKVPVLGKVPLPGFVTNEDRAMQLYHEDRNRQRWSDAMEFLTPAERERVKHPDRPASGK